MVLSEHIFVLALELVSNASPRVNIIEVVEQVEGSGSGVELTAEGPGNQADRVVLNVVYGGQECLEVAFPVFLDLWQKDVVDEA